MKNLLLVLIALSFSNSLKIKVDPSWTMSGFSSGAFMTAQMAVIHSASLKGVGIANAGVVWCSEGSGNFGDASPKCVEDASTINVATT